MAPNITTRVVLLLVLVMMMMNNEAAGKACDWMSDVNHECIKEPDCTDTAIKVDIWEDCKAGTTLFTVSDSVTLVEPCQYLQDDGGNVMSLAVEFDAEDGDDSSKFCDSFIEDKPTLFFNVLDVNEFAPMPFNGTIFQIEPLEEEEAGVITTIVYTDQDVGETQSLTHELLTPEFMDQFELTQEYNKDKDEMVFFLSTLKPLDFEDMMYYNLQYSISSKDGRGGIISTTQTILVAVVDASDTPPYWVKYYPTFSLEEGEEGRTVFEVEARDRDVMVANDIRYFLTGNETEFFDLHESTGNLTTKKVIDREELLEQNIRSFTLELMAVEYEKGTDNPATPLSNSTQVSVINIEDINNKVPTFSQDVIEVTIEELNGQDYILPTEVYVWDMDRGINGSFIISSDDKDNLEVSPTSGSLNQSLTLTAKYRKDNNKFDYEDREDTPIEFIITATEEDNTSHSNSTRVIITLTDINDNAPIFTTVDNHRVDVQETEEIGAFILAVSATDGDVTANFSTESIVYSLDQQCQTLTIDSETGNVTLNSKLDYEDTNGQTVECTVAATDEFGEGLQGVSKITITVLDVVDETPVIEVEAMEIEENSAEGDIVGEVKVSDGDSGAIITITIDWNDSSATLDGDNVVITDDMKEWFEISDVEDMEGGKGGGEYVGLLVIGETPPDRERADKITLHIVATDKATDPDTGGKDKDEEFTVITILDENDEAPVFYSWCEGDTVEENAAGDETVCNLEITDPDAEDTVMLSVDNSPFFYLEKEEVNTTSGEIVDVKILVKDKADIDREERDNVIFTVILTDKEGRRTEKKITIPVNDKNDERPQIEKGICNSTKTIEENKDDGFEFFSVTAVDGDVTEPFNTVTYRLLNLNMPGDQNRYCPFNINSTTGLVVVDRSGGKELDREQFESWELFFQADDSCGQDPDVDCVVLSSDPCTVYVEVEDKNDQTPDNFDWSPRDNSIEVDEFMKEGETAKQIGGTEYRIFATDGDEWGTPNTNLSYNVNKVTKKGGIVDLKLFTAKNEIGTGEPKYYCLLQATKDFYGQELRGEYDVHIEASDRGDPMLTGSSIIPLTINDANDNTPVFEFGGCLGENLTIYMPENYYAPNEDIVCDTQDPDEEMIIEVYDADRDPPNNVMEAELLYQNSTQVVPNGEEGQLSAFVFEKKIGGGYRLYVTENIDREKGTEYNLCLQVRDNGDPPLSSSDKLRVIVLNVSEHDPYFCEEGNCKQVLYMDENNPDVSATFQAATDHDNPEGLAPVEKVFYHIMAGDTGDFTLEASTKTTLLLQDKITGLDREAKSNYTIFVVTSNTNARPPVDHDLTLNDTLEITIQVQDKNDNPPRFNTTEMFASFMDTDTKGNIVAEIEAFDADLNETLTYTLNGDFEWHETEAQPTEEEPFVLSALDELSANLLLNFQPTGVSEGYCTFSINVQDKGEGKGSIRLKVYAITADFLVVTYFYNSISQLQSQQENIEQVFSQTLKYPCIIDSIARYEDEAKMMKGRNRNNDDDDSGMSEGLDSRPPRASDNTTVTTTMVYMHFIDPAKNEPVPVPTILNLMNNEQTANQIMVQLGMFDLILVSVQTPPNREDLPQDSEEVIVTLKILLGVVSLVLGLLVILLGTIYCLRTRSLERRVKVLSTNTFGSQGSGLDEAGTGKVPGSNMFTSEGANPMFNLEEVMMRGENASISSGDSVLVGVEDNPEFIRDKVGGLDNPPPSFMSSIDNVTAAPPTLNGGIRTNPLLQLSSTKPDDMDLSDGPSTLNLKVGAPSLSGSEDNSPIPGNENFSFSKF